MRSFVLIGCLLVVAVASALASGRLDMHKKMKMDIDQDEDWKLFKMQHKKVYEDQRIEELRREIFTLNKMKVDRFNHYEAAKRGFEMGLNHLSDRTQVELSRLNGLRVPVDKVHSLRSSRKSQEFLEKILTETASIEVPDELDYRKMPGRVTPVKDQGDCGSCWAFSVTGALEGQETVARNKIRMTKKDLIGLSEQNLIDCTISVDGQREDCSGGFMGDAFDFIKREGGIVDDETYPYKGVEGTCQFTKEKVAFTNSGFTLLPEDENKLKEILAKFGPISVAIQVSGPTFVGYKSGVFIDYKCKNNMESLDHGVLLVGYGTDEQTKQDYWIVKNSWGADWGENGYIRMARNNNNMCGIATIPIIPNVV